ARAARGAFARMLGGYGRLLDWALDHGPATVVMLLGIVALNVYLFTVIPKGFFPQQDTGQLMGGIRADQSTSFQAMESKLHEFVGIIGADPAVQNVVAFTGGPRAGGGFLQVSLKPLSVRHEPSAAVVTRLRPKLAQITGVAVFLNPVQDLRIGGRPPNTPFQSTIAKRTPPAPRQ